MKTKKRVAIFASVLIVLAAIVCVSFFKDFDAQGYVSAILDQRFKGDITKAESILKNTGKDELKKQYEEGIEQFVKDYITSGVEVDPELEGKLVELCKSIFRDMKYNVHAAEKINRQEYDVRVEFQASDVFIKFIQSIQAESENVKKKAENGEYKGTKEEIQSQMQNEFLNASYTLLESAYKMMVYSESETMIFKVESNEENDFTMKEEEISSFITKILRLDEIQD